MAEIKASNVGTIATHSGDICTMCMELRLSQNALVLIVESKSLDAKEGYRVATACAVVYTVP
jgi:hypothetical protein